MFFLQDVVLPPCEEHGLEAINDLIRSSEMYSNRCFVIADLVRHNYVPKLLEMSRKSLRSYNLGNEGMLVKLHKLIYSIIELNDASLNGVLFSG